MARSVPRGGTLCRLARIENHAIGIIGVASNRRVLRWLMANIRAFPPGIRVYQSNESASIMSSFVRSWVRSFRVEKRNDPEDCVCDARLKTIWRAAVLS